MPALIVEAKAFGATGLAFKNKIVRLVEKKRKNICVFSSYSLHLQQIQSQ